jgi:hypothetical protein
MHKLCLSAGKLIFCATAQNSEPLMGYRGWGRGRGRGFGRGAGFGRGSGQGFRYGSAQGFGMGQGPDLSPSCRRFPDRPRGWWADPAYSNVTTTQHPQQNLLEYQYARHPQQMQPPELLGYPQSPVQSFATHMSCVHYGNGFCTLRNVAVSPNGPACRSFAPA